MILSFSSPFYYLFLTFCLLLYYIFPKHQKQVLLLSSLLFIASYSLIALGVFISIQIISYYAAQIIDNTYNSINKHRAYLFFIAYVSFILVALKFTLNSLSSHFAIQNTLLLTGISFYVLQNISYLIDVYRGDEKPSYNLLHFISITSFFPKFVSGPITSYTEQKESMAKEHKYVSDNIEYGIQRILLGLFKKLVIADRLAAGVSSVFDHQDEIAGITRVVAAFMFLVQLYFDFSAYVDIAIGSARMFAIRLPENFNMPFRSKSISEFWRRWHISLVKWLTNYIYYPVYYKLRRNIKWGGIAAILCSLLVSGVWHGIGITFFIYALLHSIYLILEFIFKKSKLKLSNQNYALNFFGIILTLSLVSFSMIFFRSSSISDALFYIQSMIKPDTFFPESILKEFLAPLAVGGHYENLFNFYTCIALAGLYLIFEHKFSFTDSFKKFNYTLVFLCIILIFLFGVFGDHSRFIYMQF